ncbi:hypothetical protein DL98DRAFT_521047 [Cadophora sp. DSE1049]|nr:hypothetical protein DL98DRAFT_521047 [Cadophora sp. DSE1049]
MPRAKRPLAEADRNVNHSKSAKTTSKQKPGGKIEEKDVLNSAGDTPVDQKSTSQSSSSSPKVFGKFLTRKPKSRYSTQLVVEEEHDSDEPGTTARKETFDYSKKDGSKLRAFLVDRHLPTAGTREELIARLESSSIDYESLFSTELTEILNRRHVTGAATGTKDIKIQRIRLNDKIDYNTGDSHATILYVQRDIWEEAIPEMEQKLEALAENPYTTLTPAQLAKKLEKQNLASTGSKEAMAKRLWNHEKKDLAKTIKLRKEKLEENNAEMESYIGHPVPRGMDTRAREEKAEDARISNEMWVSRRNAVPVCDYDWKDSHWAGRTERELNEICSRRGMPGYGPKAAMLKWLDTGNIDYQDMYMGGLTRICHERGIGYKESDKKADLVRRLSEADEAEGSG